MIYNRNRNATSLYAGIGRVELWEKQRKKEKSKETRKYPAEFNHAFKERIREKIGTDDNRAHGERPGISAENNMQPWKHTDAINDCTQSV